ncbi:uncharacterized protein Z520_12049 [Fonsecaea multimorphosa CBS 102226]|uniref:Fe2OG dioxygenase domain-containing protein n=1 Tax=Fonsecaea multimorphosa CBS 102226 TaxID=1442371 RepID=A0A0D2K7H4_9EURO|nr:uncharacterized protein Z520_12049 [Fonsecaea multimorphosa CBS 102226]KIX92303.1 hypothetical protein Z520_12049 [Fonsecaea multimorphosa CBS 102226]OAL17673.1 hypothetical protein AYO22_11463 [Fonsecaea multimorphosa]
MSATTTSTMTTRLHSTIPPFPTDLVHAPIAEISSKALLEKDPASTAAVLQACQTYGFFYLDMADSEPGRELLTEAEQLHDLSKKALTLPFEEKDKYDFRKTGSFFGYKPAGTVKLTDKSQRPDSTEFFNIGKDCLFGVSPSRTYPEIIQDARPLLEAFCKGAHEMAMTILRTLARAFGEEDEDIFVNLNRFEESSGDHIRLTLKPPSDPAKTDILGLPSHTDFGSVTILFNWLGGLQIESRTPGRVGEWEYVKPLPGKAIINLGDAMVHFSNGSLKSAKHRVVPSPGAQAGMERISVVYFVRPTHHSPMKPVGRFDDVAKQQDRVKVAGKFSDGIDDGKVYTAREWLEKRYTQLASKN